MCRSREENPHKTPQTKIIARFGHELFPSKVSISDFYDISIFELCSKGGIMLSSIFERWRRDNLEKKRQPCKKRHRSLSSQPMPYFQISFSCILGGKTGPVNTGHFF
jgi:hypothetical protein